MSSEIVVRLGQMTLETAVLLAAPLLIALAVVSLAINVVQVLTSLQDNTISSVPRLLATAAGAIVLMPWMLRKLVASSPCRCWATFVPGCAEEAETAMNLVNSRILVLAVACVGARVFRAAGVHAVSRQQCHRTANQGGPGGLLTGAAVPGVRPAAIFRLTGPACCRRGGLEVVDRDC